MFQTILRSVLGFLMLGLFLPTTEKILKYIQKIFFFFKYLNKTKFLNIDKGGRGAQKGDIYVSQILHKFKLKTAHSPLPTHHSTVTTVQSPLYTVQSTQYNHHCTFTTVHSTLYSHRCTVNTLESPLYSQKVCSTLYTNKKKHRKSCEKLP